MKQSRVLLSKEVFPGSDVVHRFSFRAMDLRDNCALLAVQNHHPGCMGEQFAKQTTSLAMTPAISRGQSAHFWNFSSIDCFECLSSHIKVYERTKPVRFAKIAA